MKKHFKILVIILVILVSIFSINQIKIKADSGWDSSYDSGGSYDSGSSWDSDSGSSYYSNGNGDPVGGLIGLLLGCMVMAIIIYLTCRKDKNDRIKHRKRREEELLQKNELANKYLNTDIESLNKEISNKFIRIQEAWMNFDYDSLKKLCSNEIYNTYYEELEALKLKNGKNIMSDFNIRYIDIEDISLDEDNIIVKCVLAAFFHDYVIDTTNNKITKGDDQTFVNNVYELVFIKNNKVIENCPNCGGKIEPGTTTCSHCKAVIVQNSNEFVMSSKRKIN